MVSVTCVTGSRASVTVLRATDFVPSSQQSVTWLTASRFTGALETAYAGWERQGLMTNFTVTDDLRIELKAMASPVFKPKGAILFNQGDAATGIYLLDQGRVALYLDCGRRNFPTRIVTCGSVIGLPGTLSGTGYSLAAETLEDCTLDFIPRERLLAFLRTHPAYCFQLVELLSKEISDLRAAAQRRGDLQIA